jgi:hypothetical protein
MVPMSRQKEGGEVLSRVEARVRRWRSEHGGPGVRWPEILWAEVVEAARVAGVETAAHALGLDRGRLAARVARAGAPTSAKDSSSFVEVDTSRLCSAPPASRTVLRFEGVDGERLELEFGDGTTLDIVGLARAFWSRRR